MEGRRFDPAPAHKPQVPACEGAPAGLGGGRSPPPAFLPAELAGLYSRTRPVSYPHIATSTRLRAPSLAMRLPMWVFTVLRLM